MSHVVYVDLSAKIEQWTQNSVVAISNGLSKALLFSGKVKQETRRYLVQKHGSKSIQYRVLTLLVYLAVRDDLSKIRQIVIDRDYSGEGAEATIKNLLLTLLRRESPDIPAGFVRFENVKGSKADILARQVYHGKAKAERLVSWTEIKTILEK